MAGEVILVVDDGRESRDFIVDYILKPNQYTPLIARNGLEGLELARQHRPDLILLDLQMPKMNGMQVLDALNEENIDIPVILMTFHGNEEIAIEVFRKGVRDYVKKPYTVEEMVAAIERSMGEVRLRKEKDALTERLIAANTDLSQRIRELNALYNVGKSVTALTSLDELLPSILRAATEVTGTEEGSLHLIQGEELICRALKHPDEANIRAVYQPSKNRFAWHVIQHGQPLVVPPQEMAPLRQKNPSLPVASLYSPLTVGNRVIGALGVGNMRENAQPFRKQDGAMLSALSDYAAIAIENAANFAELSQFKDQEMTSVLASLEQVISPNLIEKLLTDDPQNALQPIRSEVSILAVDLRGYPMLIDQVQPGQLVELINRQFGLLTDIAVEYGGTIDRVSGDGALIFFNAPQTQAQHELLAVETALQLQHRMENAKASPDGLRFGIGLHMGEAVMGNVGVLSGLNYTAVGKDVLLARRLQEQARPGQILISDQMVTKLGKRIQVNLLGEMAVRGQQALVKVYELLGLA
ncbi:MAG: response regulator [Chloroflexi bacterium]|nr:response regulator [Chloroflexota bacterium]